MDDRYESTYYSDDINSTDQVRDLPRATKRNRDHTNDLIIGNPSTGVKTRNISADSMFSCFLSSNEPKSADEALLDSDWVIARAEHSVGSVQNRTEPKEPKTEFLIFYGPNRIEINVWTESEPNRNKLVRFGSFRQNRIFPQKYEKAD